MIVLKLYRIILASVHVCVPSGTSLQEWEDTEKSLRHCFSEYGITHVTVSPELHRLQSDTETQTVLNQTGEEQSGARTMSPKDGYGCVIGDISGMRKRDTGHTHGHNSHA